MDKLEHIRKLLKCIDETSSSMSRIIYLNYFDKMSSDEKYLIAMFDDAFKTASIACYSISLVALTQAGDMIRKLMEQAAIVTFLIDHKEKLPKFVEHYKLRKEIWNKTKREQISIICERFGITDERTALTYLDYGWVGNNCNEIGLLKIVGFNDLLSWKRTFLDKFVHSSFTNADLVGNDYNYPIIKNIVEIMAKCFDYICCTFHSLTGFDFVIEGKDMFQKEFRPLYSSYDVKE